MDDNAAVVVGVDGSPDSSRAVQWAAHDAACRHRPLRIVHAYIWALAHPLIGSPPPSSYEASMRHAAENVLAEAAQQASDTAPGLDISTELVVQSASDMLIRQSEHAALLVLGNRGLGGFTGLLAGSVSTQVAAHSHAPLVVVRHHAAVQGPNAGRIVVGVDGSSDSEHAIRFAFEEADLRGVALTAVHAYRWPTPAGTADMLPLLYDLDDLHDNEQRVLSEALGGWRSKYPDIEVRLHLVQGGPGETLRQAAAGAELLVVGSRGRGGFTGLLLGSVSQTMIHHATCPVAVIHHPRHR